MAEGRSRQLWDHTSAMLATIHNGLTTGRRVKPDEINPHIQSEKKRTARVTEPSKDEVKMGFALMKRAFIKNRKPRKEARHE